MSSYYEKFSDGKVVCIDEEIPFEIPEGWEWERWGHISLAIQYGYNAPAAQSGNARMVRISDIQDNKLVWDTVPYCTIPEKDIDTYLLEPNDILFARTGGTVGKSFLVENSRPNTIYAGYLIRTRYNSIELCPKYLKAYMESQLYWEQLHEGTIATAQPNCNGQTLSHMLLPIPPHSEQVRITRKLSEIEPIVDAYKTAQERLDTLNSTITCTLKKSILQYAIQGKLVPQDSSDEPASALLERIATEKQQLVKEGKLKAKGSVSSIIFKGDDNKYYEQIGTKI
ncbi:MAG: restriction endonuclease subunit S, partial [Bacteroidales bacterium]|nr:restriction endonuclease subunit S [Bacteroidales bacterium]